MKKPMLVHKEIEETIPKPTFTGRGLQIGRLTNRRRRRIRYRRTSVLSIYHNGGIGEAIDNDGW